MDGTEQARRRRRVLTARACISFFLFHLVSELEVGAARFETRSDRCTRDYTDKNCATETNHERLTSPHNYLLRTCLSNHFLQPPRYNVTVVI